MKEKKQKRSKNTITFPQFNIDEKISEFPTKQKKNKTFKTHFKIFR